MDRFQNYINSILKASRLSKTRKKELEEEIRDHLLMTKKELVESGYSEEQSEIIAVQRFGEIQDIKKGIKKVFTPYIILKETINQKKILMESLQWTFAILVAVVMSMSIKSYVFAATEVRQCSMQNTLYEGQRLIENKIEYNFAPPQRGDIVIINTEAVKGAVKIFESDAKEFWGKLSGKGDDKSRLIKRIIGVPGDTIDIKDGKVYINGAQHYEPYVKGATFPNGMEFPVKVPEKEYFVMGDNRENSMDSRMLGFISIDKIEGKATLRLWPLDKFGSVSN